MKSFIIYTIGLCSLLSFVACGNVDTDSKKQAKESNDAKIDSVKTADSGTVTKSTRSDMKEDAEFAVTAADGGMLEVQLGHMAMEKAASSEVKKLGALMVKDHSKANGELMATAKEKNITLPAVLSDKCQKKVSDLAQKKGVDFDKAYADLMVSDHKEDINLFKKEAEKGSDSQLSKWAKSKLPTLEHHLMMAENAKKVTDKK